MQIGEELDAVLVRLQERVKEAITELRLADEDASTCRAEEDLTDLRRQVVMRQAGSAAGISAKLDVLAGVITADGDSSIDPIAQAMDMIHEEPDLATKLAWSVVADLLLQKRIFANAEASESVLR